MKDDPQDAKEFIPPNGHDVIDDLPHYVADELIIDELVQEKIGGKWMIIAAVDAARKGDLYEAGRILMLARERAGQSDVAIDEWLMIKDKYDEL